MPGTPPDVKPSEVHGWPHGVYGKLSEVLGTVTSRTTRAMARFIVTALAEPRLCTVAVQEKK